MSRAGWRTGSSFRSRRPSVSSTARGTSAGSVIGASSTSHAPPGTPSASRPAATLASLQQDPQGALANVLKLHVISGNVTVDDLADENGKCVDTLGGKVKITVEGEGDDASVSFGGAGVIDGEPQTASNGTILKLDSVVTAPATDC